MVDEKTLNAVLFDIEELELSSGGIRKIEKIVNGSIDILESDCDSDTSEEKHLDESGNTSTHLAAAAGDADKIIRISLKSESCADAKNEFLKTPLHFAAGEGHIDAVLALIKLGANVNAKDLAGNTPLHCSCSNCSSSIVKILLDNGAKINLRNKNGETAIHIAATGDIDSARLLIERGAKTGFKTRSGHTPIHRAAMSENPEELIELLYSKGAKITRDRDKKNALHTAAAIGNIKALKTIIAHGARINKKGGEYGRTPLAMASISGNLKVVKFLLDAGARSDIENNRGMTPIEEIEDIYLTGVDNINEIREILFKYSSVKWKSKIVHIDGE